MEKERLSLTWRDVLWDCWWYYNLCPIRDTPKYDYVGHAAGGSLHIVLDDSNWEESYVDFCIRSAEREGDEEGLKLAKKLKQLSNLQRARLCLNKYHLYCYGAAEPKREG